ncbi:hypothetical protein [Streptomyces sp. IB2014 016-6]|uniref:hypothetical protein n=1 Tax=Streptomyces sp. IB2014 016-6 TaxID=2517818 RepID=UPI0011CC04D6|nr:hypothetical protein [Streptomyces sp. IB2014 016-6]TXL84193.1 hypothetical protein EW053_35135 [Streptomyces sp. IB2014 016-6]
MTDRLNGTESHNQAADLVNEILDPLDGTLERLADFFEAAGEKPESPTRTTGSTSPTTSRKPPSTSGG